MPPIILCSSRWLPLTLLGLVALAPARADETVDLGKHVPDVAEVQKGLFPDDTCQELNAQGFKCMGFKPAVRYSLPAASFRSGSAQLTPGIKRQLDVFAKALKGRTGNDHAVLVEGHTDSTGSEQANLMLSQRRAQAACDYLAAQGVAVEILKPVGVGSQQPLDADHPDAASNRRVVIGRDQPPAGAAN